jgi:hypothetical protein
MHIIQSHQPYKPDSADTRSNWREIERRLVDFFRSNGAEIEWDGGESYVSARVRADIEAPAYECAVIGAKPAEFLNVDYVSLSQLARSLTGSAS